MYLSAEPAIHTQANVIDSMLGEYTEVGKDWVIKETTLGAYSYCAGIGGWINYTTIGKFTSIASMVAINPGDHPMDRPSQHHFTYRSSRYDSTLEDDDLLFEWRRNRTVIVGNDVWIGWGAKIMSGVTIGDGAVIGAGSVVTHDVQPYEVVAGVPARHIKMRFADHIVEKLQQIRWWDWEHSTLMERMNDFRGDIEAFTTTYFQ